MQGTEESVSLCIKLHKARRLALPAAKQKEEETGTSEPCGLKLLMGARCPGAMGELCDAAQRSHRASSRRCH